MFSFHPFTPDDHADWDHFVQSSRNGVFLFERGYMDYHADRFADASVIVRAAPHDNEKKAPALSRHATCPGIDGTRQSGSVHQAAGKTGNDELMTSGSGLVHPKTGKPDIGSITNHARSASRKAGEILAVLPAHRVESDGQTRCVSHGGLTFGGLVMAEKLGGHQVLHLFRALLPWLRARGFDQLVYKPTPHIYHRLPSEDDIYALHQLGARTTQVQLSSTLDLQRDAPASKRYREALVIARKSGIEVTPCQPKDFWPLLTATLQSRHGTLPVHSIDEIGLLLSRFPQRIELLAAGPIGSEGKLLHAGAVLFHYDGVTHAQYLASSATGRETQAQHAAITAAIHQARASGQRWFSFGTSTTDGGRLLNEGLLRHKEMFGARSTVLQTLTLALDERCDA